MSRAREFADLAGSADAGGITGRNLVINGGFTVFQRATAPTTADGGYNTADRWRMGEAGDGAYTTERSTDHPNGSGYSLKAQVTSADSSVASGHYAYIYQQIEAQNLQHLLYGTSAAKTLTLSFWVKSNKTGIYVFDLRKPDTTHLHYNQEFTINSANTWEKKTITIVPDSNVTASGGVIDNNNGVGLEVGFGLRWGSTYTGGTSGSWSTNSNDYGTTNQVNWMDSTSNNFYLAEVQLEVGSVANPQFEHEDVGTTLRKCQRYFELFGHGVGRAVSASDAEILSPFKVDKRVAPTIALNDTSSCMAEFLRGVANITALVNTFLATTASTGNRVTSSDTGMNNGNLVGFLKEDAMSADAEL